MTMTLTATRIHLRLTAPVNGRQTFDFDRRTLELSEDANETQVKHALETELGLSTGALSKYVASDEPGGLLIHPMATPG